MISRASIPPYEVSRSGAAFRIFQANKQVDILAKPPTLRVT